MKNVCIFFVLSLMLQACSNERVVYAYVVVKSTLEERDISEWRPVMRVVYRVGESTVISEVAGLLDEYKNCEIENENNWHCKYEDGTGPNKFGFTDGVYWQKPGWNGEIMHVSRWKYNLIRCKWYQFEQGKFNGIKTCLKTYI